jgi:hypothetical protein
VYELQEVAQLIRENGGTAKHEMGDRLCEYAAYVHMSKTELRRIGIFLRFLFINDRGFLKWLRHYSAPPDPLLPDERLNSKG